MNYDHYKIFRAPQNVILMFLITGFYTGALGFPTPSQNVPPPRNLKMYDVIINMYDFSP